MSSNQKYGQHLHFTKRKDIKRPKFSVFLHVTLMSMESVIEKIEKEHARTYLTSFKKGKEMQLKLNVSLYRKISALNAFVNRKLIK